MNIIIAGDGMVGSTLARRLSAEGYNLTMIDSDPNVLETSIERYDAMAVHGNCASMSVLERAGVMDADLLIAATSADEINLLCCTTAHGMNPKLHTIARIRNPEYTDQIYRMRDLFALSMAINPEKQAATEMGRLLKYPGFLRRDTFAKGKTEIVELRVDAGSKLCNVPLIEMYKIVKCKVLVCAVLRGGTAVVPNRGDFVLKAGDRIFVTAPTENLTILLKNLGIITRRVRSVMLCGGVDGVPIYLCHLRIQRHGIGHIGFCLDWPAKHTAQHRCKLCPGHGILKTKEAVSVAIHQAVFRGFFHLNSQYVVDGHICVGSFCGRNCKTDSQSQGSNCGKTLFHVASLLFFCGFMIAYPAAKM